MSRENATAPKTQRRPLNPSKISQFLAKWLRDFVSHENSTICPINRGIWKAGGRESRGFLFVLSPRFALGREAFHRVRVRPRPPFRPFASGCRLLRPVRARCHSKCHSTQSSSTCAASAVAVAASEGREVWSRSDRVSVRSIHSDRVFWPILCQRACDAKTTSWHVHRLFSCRSARRGHYQLAGGRSAKPAGWCRCPAVRFSQQTRQD